MLRIFILALLFVQTAFCLDDNVIALVRKLRWDPQLQDEDDRARVENLLIKIYDCLPDYSQNNLLDSVTHFLADQRVLEPSNTIVNSSDTDFSGNSQDAVFFVYNPDLMYVVKAFQYPQDYNSDFAPEISALDFIENLRLDSATPILMLGTAKCTIGGVDYGLLLETAASGMRIDQWIYAISDQLKGSTNRNKALHQAKQAFSRLGYAFGELHRVQSSEWHPFSEGALIRLWNKYKSLHYGDIHLDIDLKMLKLKLEKLTKEASEHKIHLGYRHGDAHSGNLFYDISLDKVMFIDVANMHDSFDRNNEPHGDSAWDFIRIEESLRRKGFGLLDQEEIDVLITCFETHYEKVSPLPDPFLNKFYTDYIKLGRIVDYAEWKLIADPLEQERERGIYEDSIRYFTLNNR